MARINCLQEVSGTWFAIGQTSVPRFWSVWWHDRLGIFWNAEMVHCPEAPKVRRAFPSTTGANRSLWYFVQVACVLKL